jgi:glycosyltransferase involved in cell wall biosynthesis
MPRMEFEVSVIIPVWNAELFVEKAVKSALEQPEVAEVLLVEDGSTDNSVSVCRRLAEGDQRIKLLRHPNGDNRGAGASRNLGLAKATCEFIAFLDADDYYLPHRFEETVNVFARYPDADGVYEAIGAEFTDGVVQKEFELTGLSKLTTISRTDIAPEKLFKYLVFGERGRGHFHLNGLTLKQSALDKMNSWFNANLRLHQDTEFIYRLAYYCHLFPGENQKEVARRTVHDNNRITRAFLDKESIINSRYLMFRALRNWAEQENVALKVATLFKKRELVFGLRKLRGLRKWNRFIWICMKHSKMLSDGQTRYMIFDDLQNGTMAEFHLAKAIEYMYLRITSR